MSMNTSGNLLTLVNQLQQLESALTTFLFEAVLKLGALTEAGVFLMVETPDRRRFAGTPSLVDSFGERTLTPRDGDVQITLDPSSVTLVEQRTFPSRKRLATPSSSGPSPLKAPRPNLNSPCENVLVSTHAPQIPWTESALARTSVFNLDTNGGVASPAGNVQTDVKPSIDSGDDVLKYEDCVVIDDDDLEEESLFDPNGADSSLSSSYSPAGLVATGATSRDALSLATNPLEARKIEALLAIKDPWSAYVKGTVENRLLASVFYSVGKNIAQNCPFPEPSLNDPQVLQFFDEKISEAIMRFPRLNVDRNQIPYHVKNADLVLEKRGVTGYIRVNARSAFKKACVKAAKQNAV